MAVLAVLSTPNTDGAPDSTPRRIVSKLPGVEIDVVHFERAGNSAIPYIWMRGASAKEFETVLREDPRISEVHRLERTGDGAFYKVVWDVDSPVIQCVAATNGVIMEAHGRAEQWHLKIWFEDGSDASKFQRCCSDQNVPLRVHRLTSLADARSEDGPAVSQRQYEAMVLAYRGGYFEEPRRVSQEDLAAELGISSSAFGRRLRRGFASLIEETLLE